MTTTHLSHEKRSEILRNVGKLLPHTSSNEISERYDEIFLKYAPTFTELVLKQIIKHPKITKENFQIGDYKVNDLLPTFQYLFIPIDKIYMPKLVQDWNGRVATWGEQHAYYTNDRHTHIQLQLQTPLRLPICHKYSKFDSNGSQNANLHNQIDMSGDMLDLFIEFNQEATNAQQTTLKHNRLIELTATLLKKFTTTKQLTNAWPEIESFIPVNYLGKSIRQKKAKPVPLSEKEKQWIQEISKELLIQKMIKGI